MEGAFLEEEQSFASISTGTISSLITWDRQLQVINSLIDYWYLSHADAQQTNEKTNCMSLELSFWGEGVGGGRRGGSYSISQLHPNSTLINRFISSCPHCHYIDLEMIELRTECPFTSTKIKRPKWNISTEMNWKYPPFFFLLYSYFSSPPFNSIKA
jgi:hypothetical protein